MSREGRGRSQKTAGSEYSQNQSRPSKIHRVNILLEGRTTWTWSCSAEDCVSSCIWSEATKRAVPPAATWRLCSLPQLQVDQNRSHMCQRRPDRSCCCMPYSRQRWYVLSLRYTDLHRGPDKYQPDLYARPSYTVPRREGQRIQSGWRLSCELALDIFNCQTLLRGLIRFHMSCSTVLQDHGSLRLESLVDDPTRR